MQNILKINIRGRLNILHLKIKEMGGKNPSALVEIEGKEIMIKDYVNVFIADVHCAHIVINANMQLL
ncbi:MAG: hypothetical protein ACLRR3_01740 [Eubacterium sp.]